MRLELTFEAAKPMRPAEMVQEQPPGPGLSPTPESSRHSGPMPEMRAHGLSEKQTVDELFAIEIAVWEM